MGRGPISKGRATQIVEKISERNIVVGANKLRGGRP